MSGILGRYSCNFHTRLHKVTVKTQETGMNRETPVHEGQATGALIRLVDSKTDN